MRVRLSSEIVNDTGMLNFLDDLMRLFEERVHILDLTNLEEILASRWSQDPGRSGRRVRDFLERAATHAAFLSSRPNAPHQTTVCVVLPGQANASTSLSPEETRAYLERPLTVVVENGDSDWAFLEALAKKLGTRELSALMQNDKALRIDSAGGHGDILKRVTQHRNRGGSQVPARLFVLVDSDALLPWAPEEATSWARVNKKNRKIAEACVEAEIPCWVLRKREIENYLPLRALEEWCHGERTRNALTWLRRLSPLQLDFFDMKKGFRAKDERGETTYCVPETQRSLYASLEVEHMDDSAGGFGDNVWKAFNEWGAYKARDLRERSNPSGLESEVEVDLIVARLCALL